MANIIRRLTCWTPASILNLFSSELKYHKIIFTSKQRSSALVILDGIEKIEWNNFLNISGYGLGLKLTEADIDLNFFIGEGDDGHSSIGSCG